MKRLTIYALAGTAGIGLGGYTALAMAGLAPGGQSTGTGIEINRWVGDLDQGSADASPYLRARIARHGLLALAKSEAIYFVRNVDDDGRAFSENCTYQMSGGQLPAAWWSVTLYDAEGFLPNNNDEALSFDAKSASDGGWSAIISPTRPVAGGNWISSRNAGSFDLTLRLYVPEAQVLERPAERIVPPKVEKLHCEYSKL